MHRRSLRIVRSVVVLIVAALLAAIIVGCGEGRPSVVDPQTTRVTYDLSVVVTVGDRSYIPINQGGRPGDTPSFILNILKAFEDENPQFEILNWKIEKHQGSSGAEGYIFGLWVDHRPKQ